MRFHFIWFMAVLGLCPSSLRGQNSADSFDIPVIRIELDIPAPVQKQITGSSVLKLVHRYSGSGRIVLDLQGLVVSSCSADGSVEAFQQAGKKLYVNLPAGKQTGDTTILQVNYSGSPVKDPRWGGFYFSGDYAFNLGVGFAESPHSFGRCWFPCFDTFTRKSVYSFSITVDSGYTAMCNGILIDTETVQGNRRRFHWQMNKPIPAYLASVAVAPYSPVRFSVPGMAGQVPVVFGAKASDTAAMKSTFAKIGGVLNLFESQFGRHPFEKIGFNLVPFGGGAMEHAGNIAYPVTAIGGNAWETLWAHEFSHHWWGNHVTCTSAADMWLNEGWASYCERLFTEAFYGRNEYRNDVSSNRYGVLRYAHLKDGACRAVSNMADAYTYGEHVYKKGADMVHTLRNWMGDSAFFAACRSYQDSFAYRNASTANLYSHFSKYSRQDLKPFFDQWIAQPGFPHYYIARWSVSGNNRVRVVVDHNSRFTGMIYTGVPAVLSFFDRNRNRSDRKIVLNGQGNEYFFDLPFQPVYLAFDFDDLLGDAVTDEILTLRSGTTAWSMDYANISGTVSAVTDSALLRVEHHWNGPSGQLSVPFVSNYRYWTVGGIWPADFRTSARFSYDARMPADKSYGYLDHTILSPGYSEDSIVLMYRPNADAAWQQVQGITRFPGSKTDGAGYVTVPELKQGDYCWAVYDRRLAVQGTAGASAENVRMYPNPVGRSFLLRGVQDPRNIRIFNTAGQEVICRKTIESEGVKVNTEQLSPGIYLVKGNEYCIRFVKE